MRVPLVVSSRKALSAFAESMAAASEGNGLPRDAEGAAVDEVGQYPAGHTAQLKKTDRAMTAAKKKKRRGDDRGVDPTALGEVVNSAGL